MNEHKTRERFAEVHTPCPCGRSSDAYCVRSDGSGYCFSCGEDFQNDAKDDRRKDNDLERREGSFVIKSHRGISKKVYEHYDVETKVVDDQDVECGFPYGSEAAKIKNLSDKTKQYTIGHFQEAPLFGMDKFDPGSKDAVIITEGEEDAMAAYEMMRMKFAAVSLKTGSQGAARDLGRKDIWEWVNSFPKIYICFDNDEPGRNATKAIQGIFDFRKTYHVKMSRFKDANDYLKNHESDDFERTVQNAKRFAPDNIISSFSEIRNALKEQKEEALCTWPFPELQEKTYGLHAGEVIVVKAQEGVGKTEVLRALEYHVLKQTGHPLGIIHFEEDNSTTIKAIAGYELKKPATLPLWVTGLSEDEVFEAYKKAVNDDEGRVHIHSAFDVEDEEAFYGSIRFLAGPAGCKVICLDHISWMGTGLQEEDERKKLDRISQRLKLLAKELRFCLIMVSHINDDGKTRGSRNISKVANTVLFLDRDLKVGDNVTSFLLEKVRLGGRTGPAGYGYFDRDQGMLLADKPDPKLGEDEQ